MTMVTAVYRPKFSITPHLLEIIEEISAFREKIVAAAVQVPWIPALQKDTRARNTHASTAIENNPLTLEQVRVLEEGKSLTAQQRAKREVTNYLSGLRFIEKHQEKKTIGHEYVLKLHSIIASGVMMQGTAGRYRTIDVRVGNYLPPPANQVSGLMSELLAWWNRESGQWSPVVTSAIVHYRFEEIHPFGDGNGRVGRALALLELYRRGFDTHHIFSIDEIYWENRQRYYEALSSVRRQGGDLTGWLEFTAEALHLALERTWVRVQHLAARSGSKKIVLRPKQEQLLQILRDRKSLAPREIWDGLGISKQGAMDLIRPLVRAGMVKHIGTKKSGRYILA